MKVNLILPGLTEENRQAVFSQMTALLEDLPPGTVFQALSSFEEDHIMEVLSSADLTILCGTAEGEAMGRRLAASAGIPLYPDVEKLEYSGGGIYAIRAVFSGHLKGVFPAEGAVLIAGRNIKSKEAVRKDLICILEKAGSFSGTDLLRKASAYTITEETPVPYSEDLGKAKVIFLGGCGLGTKENYLRMKELAKQFGASAGCTRLAALKGWADYDEVVGISGWHLGADLCIVFGASGAGPFLAGLKDVKKIVVVNNDKNAAIFRFAHYGICDDCSQILEELEKL